MTAYPFVELPAVLGGDPVRGPEKSWPKWPMYDAAELAAVHAVLESRRWFNGPRVARFEDAFARFQGARHCVACNSGTAALEIALQAVGVRPGDEVIVPPYTFVATASAVLRVGAVPVFVDVDDSWCIDPDRVVEAITPRTRAIVPVHFGGRICDMDRLKDIASEHGLKIVEDACHAWGGRWVGRGAGTLGDCGVFSFQESKNITAGEGGAIVTNDGALAEICRSITNCGRETGMPWYHHVRVGTNARMSELVAAVLVCQLDRAVEQLLRRERNAAWLEANLSGLPGLSMQVRSNRITRWARHLFCFRLDPEGFGCDRDRFVAAARAEGLPVSPGYPVPLYRQPLFEKLPREAFRVYPCPVAEDLCRRSALWLPHYVLLGDEVDMADVVAIIRKLRDNAEKLRAWTPPLVTP